MAQWLRNLMAKKLIPIGDVDERSIAEVKPNDLAGYTQCHFFAGLGGWSHALRLAGWPDDKPVWTGSCPCQPFSIAGKRKAEKDARHLWPEFRRLIGNCRPTVVFGEQVESKLGRAWFDTVRTDLETMDYAVGAADLCAASIGAAHRRQRLFFVASSSDTNSDRYQQRAKKNPLQQFNLLQLERLVRASLQSALPAGKRSLLSDGIPCRMDKLRALGNAIVPPLAAEFIRAFMEIEK